MREVEVMIDRTLGMCVSWMVDDLEYHIWCKPELPLVPELSGLDKHKRRGIHLWTGTLYTKKRSIVTHRDSGSPTARAMIAQAGKVVEKEGLIAKARERNEQYERERCEDRNNARRLEVYKGWAARMFDNLVLAEGALRQLLETYAKDPPLGSFEHDATLARSEIRTLVEKIRSEVDTTLKRP